MTGRGHKLGLSGRRHVQADLPGALNSRVSNNDLHMQQVMC
jgi:hypothetical protein